MFWLLPWRPAPAMMVFAFATAALYLRGATEESGWKKTAFWFGWLSLYISAQTRFQFYATHAFFLHQLQHSFLQHTGPFLIALSRPGAALFRGVPARWQPALRCLLAIKPLGAVAKFLNQPAIAALLFCGLTGFWLLPRVHALALLDGRWEAAMAWSMGVDGLLFWGLALNNFALRPARLSASARIALLLAVIPPQIALGMLLFFSPRDLYPAYAICGRSFLSPLLDQQLGGLILWLHGAMMSILAILVVARREWVRR